MKNIFNIYLVKKMIFIYFIIYCILILNMFNTFFQDGYLVDYNQDEVLLDSYINIDSNQVFPKLNISYIDRSICKSNNPKTGLFLGENPHLINADYLNENENDWAVNFLINNPHYINETYISLNKNDIAVKFLINNPQYIDKEFFSENESNLAVNFLINNTEYIDKFSFAYNKNELAINFIRHNPKYDFY